LPILLGHCKLDHGASPLDRPCAPALLENGEARSWFFAGRDSSDHGGAMSGSIELRRAAVSDADAIRRLTREASAKWVAARGREPKPMTADYDAAVRNHRFDLLYLEGALAALIETVDEGEVLLIENVAVSPVHQGHGLGTRLLALADQIAADQGAA